MWSLTTAGSVSAAGSWHQNQTSSCCRPEHFYFHGTWCRTRHGVSTRKGTHFPRHCGIDVGQPTRGGVECGARGPLAILPDGALGVDHCLPARIQQTDCTVHRVGWSVGSLPCDRCQHTADRVWTVTRTAIDVDLDGPILLA